MPGALFSAWTRNVASVTRKYPAELLMPNSVPLAVSWLKVGSE